LLFEQAIQKLVALLHAIGHAMISPSAGDSTPQAESLVGALKGLREDGSDPARIEAVKDHADRRSTAPVTSDSPVARSNSDPQPNPQETGVLFRSIRREQNVLVVAKQARSGLGGG
jgi:hypothetical protein